MALLHTSHRKGIHIKYFEIANHKKAVLHMVRRINRPYIYLSKKTYTQRKYTYVQDLL